MTQRLLANENFPAPSVEYLSECGHDVAPIAKAGGALSDSQVLARAVAEQRWIITFDRDYGDLIFARGMMAPPAVVLFRLRSYRPDTPGRLLAGLIESGIEFEGFFVVVEDAGLRRRPLPENKSGRG